MKRIITLAAALVFSSASFASSSWVQVDREADLNVGTFATQEQAQNAAEDFAASLNAMSAQELKAALPTNQHNFVRNVRLGDSSVSVEQVTNGEYQASLQQDYAFTAFERD
ncbi:DUF3316 domain-containing protein [Vibrio sp. D404a]|uniref:DUF3316 domain-containing protein n=1 Tax=unclassified Vibrio TaxID=2614977 RepID=UPI002556729F|nr:MULTISPECIES: DUF3316 domain-containing protein [unclassified Vibrio]MDK9738255.1 DUF3316 domain-containing protein [Vibrio sp. D404a]MDK9796546.1 DUF3316 domain-containing protein [Vibrio sp. D449a]